MPDPIDPRVICCAAGACCEDGSPEQLEALAQVYRSEMPKHTGAAMTPGIEVAFARITLEHFRLKSRKELPEEPAKEIEPEEPKPEEKGGRRKR